ncbi:hypothetical protein KFK09_027137 [Dendrobium nobile]|uniref:Uncharacterized protein n=1 Tax=Dendrobium nobile TaxID=94219 RepID=A0A8T3AA83_DENNO|nr:hypothetical protein KFK09_027137 [Dendrobium nobile]
MDSSSCIDESSASSDAGAAILSPSPTPPSPPPPLQRMGSGTSTLTIAESSSESRKLPSSQYKGVVPQPNGRWGAQIYEKHQRVWLGTFNLEREAACAYDAAAQRFRGRDAATNFPPLSPDAHELAFLHARSKAEVVDMLRKHTYLDELHHSRLRLSPPPSFLPSASKPPREHLFDKSVTPSDVGKLNRLVIPKQQAEKHFSLPGVVGGEGAKGLLLSFEDGVGKVWRFRYSYWNSSQSYVLTKGWSRFVKEKGLKAGDTVGFYRSKGGDGQLYIECRIRAAVGGVVSPAKVFRLFGVDIMKAAVGANENGKRGLEALEAAMSGPGSAGWFKKQCVVGM